MGSRPSNINSVHNRPSSGSSIVLNQNRRNYDDLHSGTMSEQVKQNKMQLQALPEYGSLERDVK
ncbi:unnamed protein product, partial [Rotaria magnacalcarata]